MDETKMEIAGAQNAYRHIGLALFNIQLVSVVVKIAVISTAQALLLRGYDFVNTSWFFWAANFVPGYLIAYPVGIVIMKWVPHSAPEKNKLKIGDLLAFFAMCIPLMYLGSIIGNILSVFFSGGTAENPLDELVADSGIYQFLIMVVIAPIFEELIFRKVIIDRTRRYGERSAIFFSAMMFGLCHGNLFQFFYAYILGLLFAYVYMRTGYVRYTIILHMAINFMGSILAPYMGRLAESLSEETPSPDQLIVSFYSLALIALIVVGIVLLVLRAKRVHLEPAEEQIPEGRQVRTVYGNGGVILFLVLSALHFVVWLTA